MQRKQIAFALKTYTFAQYGEGTCSEPCVKRSGEASGPRGLVEPRSHGSSSCGPGDVGSQPQVARRATQTFLGCWFENVRLQEEVGFSFQATYLPIHLP